MGDSSIVDIPNTHPHPENNFQMANAEVEPLLPDAIATWHTHVTGNSNLSLEDFTTFLSLPDLFHVIVGQKDISIYYVKNGIVYLGNYEQY